MELVVKKPHYNCGVYVVIQLVKLHVYVGETDTLHSRFCDHICGIAGIDGSRFYKTNENLKNENDKRFLIVPLRNCDKIEKQYYETIFMFLMRKFGFSLYNCENDNTGYARKFIVDYKDDCSNGLEDLAEKTVESAKKLLENSSKTNADIRNDIYNCEKELKSIFKSVLGIDDSERVSNEQVNLERLWADLVYSNKNCKVEGKDSLSKQYLLIDNKDNVLRACAQLDGSELNRQILEACGVKTMKTSVFSEIIRQGQLDTTIFTTFGGYLDQLPETILAIKTEDIERIRIEQISEKGWKLVPRTKVDMNEGVCIWSFKKLCSMDTRKFLETSGEKTHKYIILKYTNSDSKAGQRNAKDYNPVDNESFKEFESRYRESVRKVRNKSRVAGSITVGWSEGDKCTTELPDEMFPEIISDGENRAFLISNFYMLDRVLKDPMSLLDFYWRHHRGISDNGYEKPEKTEVLPEWLEKNEGKYDRVEYLPNGKCLVVNNHVSMVKTGYVNVQCGRIKDDKSREELASYVLNNTVREEESINMLIAELTYPYIVDVN